MPLAMPALGFLSPMSIWIILLFTYAYIASVLPVWSLLQPRDYINSHQLVLGLALITLGVVFARPEIVAPAVQMAPKGAPPILPFLFITIACGAISGFHSLVSSGTSSKQLKNEEDIHFIGYGGMLTIDCKTRAKAEELMSILQNKERFGYIAVSLGYFDTLISCSGSSTSSEIPPEDQLKMGLSPGLVRVAIGFTGSLDARIEQIERAVKAVGLI